MGVPQRAVQYDRYLLAVLGCQDVVQQGCLPGTQITYHLYVSLISECIGVSSLIRTRYNGDGHLFHCFTIADGSRVLIEVNEVRNVVVHTVLSKT